MLQVLALFVALEAGIPVKLVKLLVLSLAALRRAGLAAAPSPDAPPGS